MNTKNIFLLSSLGIVVLGLVVALCVIFFVREPYVPSLDSLDATTDITTSNVENQQSLVGGSVEQTDVQTAEGMYYRELSAVADEGYVFAYWKNSTNKLSGDEQITVGASSLDALSSAVAACSPVFVEKNNVVLISSASDFLSKLVADTNQDQTTGKIYKLTQDLGNINVSSSLGVFRGILDGNNHSISCSQISGSGLFSSLNDGVIKNLIFADGKIEGTSAVFVGTFCGSINNGLISRCLSYAQVENQLAGGYAGGLVGVCSSTDVRSMLFSSGFYGSVTAETPQQMIGQNGTISGSNVESCAVFRPKANGATYTL